MCTTDVEKTLKVMDETVTNRHQLNSIPEELIPEASSGEHSNLSTIGFAVGFVLMMVLDVVMG